LLIRGKPIARVKQCLESYRASAGYSGRPRLFLLNRSGFGYSLSSLLLGNRILILKLAVQFLTGKAILLRVSLPAHSLRVKNNIRVFFDAPDGGTTPITAKIALPSKYRTGSLAHEIEARRLLQAHTGGRFAIPVIIRCDAPDGAWLEEEFVPSSSASKGEKIRIFLGEVAPCVYRGTLRRESAAQALPRMGLTVDDLAQAGGPLGLNVALLENPLTVGYIHGDLSPENMILGRGGQLHLIDWELSRTAPIAWDLKKIFFYDQAGTLALLESLRSEGDMSARGQMHVALCCQLACLKRDRDARFAYLTSNRNKTHTEANDMIAKQETELQTWIRQLAQG